MSVFGLSGFVQGFADARKEVKAQKRIDADNARQDRWLDIVEKNPGLINASYGLPPAGGGEYGGASPGGMGVASGGDAGGSGGLFALTAKHEGAGNPDTLFGHAQNGGRFDGVRVSEMTIGEALAFANPKGEYGQWVAATRPDKENGVATPMGKHQIVGSTLKGAVKGMGLSMDAPFNEQTQDSIANYLARNRIAGLKSPAAKRAALRSEWQGFNNVSDAALDAAIAEFEANGMGLGPVKMGIQ